jgi:hypothetical protein
VRLLLEIAFLDSRRVLVSPEQFILDLRDWRLSNALYACVGRSNQFIQLVGGRNLHIAITANTQTDLDSSITSILRVPPNKPPPPRLSTFESDVDTTKYAWVNDLAPTTLTALRPI